MVAQEAQWIGVENSPGDREEPMTEPIGWGEL